VCAACGSALKDGAKFCPNCGAPAAGGNAKSAVTADGLRLDETFTRVTELCAADDYEAAIEICDEYLAGDETAGLIQAMRATAYYQTGNVEGALAGFARAVELGIDLYKDMWYLWGCACGNTGDWTGAVERFNKAQEAGFDNFELVMKRADAYNELQQHDLAEKDLASAREYTDENGSPLYESDWMYFCTEAALHDNRGRYAEAVQSLDRALALIDEAPEGMEEDRSFVETTRSAILGKAQSPASVPAPGAKFCASCGAALTPGAKFCAACGAACGAGCGTRA
jgi:tetratricopeptide (TPR) repeat protein/RNA polymerase subunit RPABC4/transcription elongation factor Spt4